MPIEVEMKFAIPSESEIISKLDDLGANWRPPLPHCDEYWAHPCRDFSKTDEAFRIRQSGDEWAITYKGPKLDPNTKTRREMELSLPFAKTSVAESVAQLRAILEALGFRSVAKVDKTRHTAELEFAGKTLEVCLDQLQGIGSFLEIECVCEEPDVDSAREAVLELSRRLTIGPSIRASYLEMWLKQKEGNG